MSLKCINCFRSLGVPARMELYKYLHEKGSTPVSVLVDVVGLSQPTVSHHLHDMQSSGLLKSKRIGKQVFFEISKICPIYECNCVVDGLNFPTAIGVNNA